MRFFETYDGRCKMSRAGPKHTREPAYDRVTKRRRCRSTRRRQERRMPGVSITWFKIRPRTISQGLEVRYVKLRISGELQAFRANLQRKISLLFDNYQVRSFNSIGSGYKLRVRGQMMDTVRCIAETEAARSQDSNRAARTFLAAVSVRFGIMPLIRRYIRKYSFLDFYWRSEFPCLCLRKVPVRKILK
jgi:hypothetical protein